jgi:hypothetical protein
MKIVLVFLGDENLVTSYHFNPNPACPLYAIHTPHDESIKHAGV